MLAQAWLTHDLPRQRKPNQQLTMATKPLAPVPELPLVTVGARQPELSERTQGLATLASRPAWP